MGRGRHKLSARTVAAISGKGLYGDGGGLWLQVSAFGTKSWIFRFSLNRRAREMGLGSVNDVSLSEAREVADACRRLVREGRDPIEERETEKRRKRQAKAEEKTFRECAEACMASLEIGWRNPKHRQQWRNTLAAHAYPLFGDLPVRAVETGQVMEALEPLWATKTETASRLRGRIEAVLDWATARGYRTGENPARWRGHLDHLLPKRSKVRKVEHHAALPYAEMGAFMAALRGQDSIGARGLEFQILTATRTGEVIGARWEEIDLAKRIWTIPAERMKAGKEHRVPLSDSAVAVLEAMEKVRLNEYVFPGARRGRPLSNMAFLQLLRRMGRGDLTAHGFRSTFRDWAAEATAHPRDVCEFALAHRLRDKVEEAYQRSDLFEKRLRLMEDWAAWCARVPAGEGENVVPMRKARHPS
jgi:integrase